MEREVANIQPVDNAEQSQINQDTHSNLIQQFANFDFKNTTSDTSSALLPSVDFFDSEAEQQKTAEETESRKNEQAPTPNESRERKEPSNNPDEKPSPKSTGEGDGRPALDKPSNSKPTVPGSEVGSSPNPFGDATGKEEAPFLERTYNNVLRSIEKLTNPPREVNGDRSGSTTL